MTNQDKSLQTTSKPKTLTDKNYRQWPQGVHADRGAGKVQCLSLKVPKQGNPAWVYRYRRDGKLVEMRLGLPPAMTLKQARATAMDLTNQRYQGVDPKEARDDAKAARKRERQQREQQAVTFGDVAKQAHLSATENSRNPKHKAQWINTINQYAADILDKPVGDVTDDDIFDLLEPIWHTKRETARRVRQRIERVFRYAKVKKLVDSNPTPSEEECNIYHGEAKKKVRHHPSLHYSRTGAFLRQHGRKKRTPAALALEFAIFTAARSGEVRGATWSEIDLEAATWTIPASRMKAEREHRVPLSDAALAILDEARTLPQHDDLVFPSSHQSKKPPFWQLSDATLCKRLRDACLEDENGEIVVVHGFRTTFRGWCADNSVAYDVAERALAHQVKESLQAAYDRGDLLELRRPVMQQYADYLMQSATGERATASKGVREAESTSIQVNT